ncbi:Endonuclease/exonuclease/phosphatase [Umbelopsis sp. AD052]|nr:Endonuclease/exonuclease/phosphatase [Umbelopsis sp. AD052]
MAFPPSLSFEDEGRYLWLGMQDGAIMVVDVLNGDVVGKRTDVHSAPITNMLRFGNEEIWTIDDAGHMNAWPVIKGSRGHTNHPLEIHPRREQVSSKLSFAINVEQQLWMASGRVLDVYDIKLSGGATNRMHTRVPNNVGNVTQLAAVPYHRGKVFVGHDDGKVTVWDTATLEITQTISLSIYGVSCMQSVGEYYLWAGYNTGMIYVYDTRPERWEVVKMWKAHGAQVLHLLLDETPLVKDNDLIQVASLDSNGTIQIWDGLLSDNWRDQAMNKRMKEYCDYRDAKILISSWNIDANKPEKFDAQDELKIREWLTSLRDPDIIVVGIQEIVDLESKKQTAKSFFSTKKKSSVPMEEEEMLTHRYRLWHNYLVHILATEYGQDCYTVVKTEQLVGLFSCIFVRTSEAGRVFDKHSTVVKTGIKVMSKSIHGNKGGIAIRFLFDHTSMCFVNCHLAAGQTHVRQRNSDAEGILQLANLEPLPQYYDVFVNGGDGAFVLDHELCFMSGDFNYRIDMGRDQVIKLLSSANKDAAYATLQDEDQLRKQKIVYPLFKLLLFKEAPIRFDPTYKYDPGTDFYDRSEKKRIPAWCDRILYRGADIKSEYYRRHEARASDHRPISSGFLVKVKTIDDQRRDRIMEKVELAWHQTLEKLIQKKKVDWLTAYGVYNQYEAQQELASANWNMMEVLQT